MLPTFTAILAELAPDLVALAVRELSKEGGRRAWVRVTVPVERAEALAADGWTQHGRARNGLVEMRRDADPDVPYEPPKPPKPSPDRIAQAATRIRAAESDEAAAALLALVMRGEAI